MKTRNATVSFKTVGCRLNQAETATMRASFEETGYKTVKFGEKCDVCVIHGCVVTAKAEEDSLRLARSIKRKYPETFVVLAGCAAEFFAKSDSSHGRAEQPASAKPLDEAGPCPAASSAAQAVRPNLSGIPRRHAGVDYLAGQNEKFNLANILSPAGSYQKRETHNIAPAFSTKRAIVKIQDGCDCRCKYCIVPSVRGPSKSRPADEILDEITRLTLEGFTEIILTGANIGCFSDNECKLPQLLEKVEAIPTLQRFRISSLEVTTPQSPQQGEAAAFFSCSRGTPLPRPLDNSTPRKIIDFMSSSKKMCFFLHLPLQSGSDKILKAMGRPYSAGEYRAIVAYAQKKLGLFGLGADVIVGFPGETEDDFLATRQIVEQLPFSNLHVFSYSPRPGTPATSMPGQVAKKDKDRRARELIGIGLKKRKDSAKIFIGKRLSMVVEKIKDGWAEGWTGEYFRARVWANDLKPKQITEFICKQAEDDVLLGRL